MSEPKRSEPAAPGKLVIFSAEAAPSLDETEIYEPDMARFLEKALASLDAASEGPARSA